MKALATFLIAFGFFAGSTAMAAGGNSNDPASPANSPTTTAASPANAASPAEARMEEELQELRDMLVTQGKQFQQQNEELKGQLEEQEQKVRTLEEQLGAKVPSGDPETIAAVSSSPGLSTGLAGNSAPVAAGSANAAAEDAPVSIHLK